MAFRWVGGGVGAEDGDGCWGGADKRGKYQEGLHVLHNEYPVQMLPTRVGADSLASCRNNGSRIRIGGLTCAKPKRPGFSSYLS